jgi:hypothetical protein
MVKVRGVVPALGVVAWGLLVPCHLFTQRAQGVVLQHFLKPCMQQKHPKTVIQIPPTPAVIEVQCAVDMCPDRPLSRHTSCCAPWGHNSLCEALQLRNRQTCSWVKAVKVAVSQKSQVVHCESVSCQFHGPFANVPFQQAVAAHKLQCVMCLLQLYRLQMCCVFVAQAHL